MKIRCLGLLLVTVFVAFSLAGCGCFMQAQKGEAPPPKPPEAKADGSPGGEEGSTCATSATTAEHPLRSAAAVPGLNNIYFDFDRYNVRPGDAEILKKNLDWFKANAEYQGKDRRKL